MDRLKSTQEDVHSETRFHDAGEICSPNSTPVDKWEEFEDFEVYTAASRKYIALRWMYYVKWKDWENGLWKWAEDMAGCKEQLEKWNSAHLVMADNPSKLRWGRWKEG